MLNKCLSLFNLPLNKEQMNKYNESKYKYYHKLLLFIIIMACLCEISYFISDCQIFGRFAKETFIPRFSILIPMLLYILAYLYIENHKFMTIFSLIVLHCNMWCTIWAIYFLPNKEFAREGFIIMHFMFLGSGLCISRKSEFIAHILVFANIFISHTFNHYEHLDMMISLELPVMIATELFLLVCDRTYHIIFENEENLKNMTITDQLTGAYNRNKINALCSPETTILNLKNTYITILDIDFFKKINDTYGHNKGDIVLVDIVKKIKKCVKEDDIVLRWGGEEFVIIFPNTTQENAVNMSELIRTTIQNECTSVDKITVSMGLSNYIEGESYIDAVKRADIGLYNAKETGRNKLVINLLEVA